ncbi:hypothetical protein O7635_00100 [Asanoa sp. WMMD1127]|uniref:hypothetical protein n=1 Tax=Asanoa sp. WMMD1127 TaxID=3016107 RepID=UPI002415DF9E|nr:hypothetical protein [Asanoa sp. WMMD1127]MDG4820272.1 hypothetical protein [Asanoa sp. WMMD1127]
MPDVIEDLLRRHAEADGSAADDLLEELARIAGRDPSALTPHLAALLDRGVVEVPSIYVGADDTVRARQIDLIDAGLEAHSGKGDAVANHLSALAHAGGTLAEEPGLRDHDGLRRPRDRCGPRRIHGGRVLRLRHAPCRLAAVEYQQS